MAISRVELDSLKTVLSWSVGGQLSGLLAAETRKWDGIELKFIEPAEARMPDKKWRLYEFKGDEQTKVCVLPAGRLLDGACGALARALSGSC